MKEIILKALFKVAYIGVDESKSFHEVRCTLLVNLLNLLLLFLATLCAIVYYPIAHFLTWMILVYLVLGGFTFVLNYYKKFLAARLYFFATAWVLIAPMSTVIGKEGNGYLFILTSIFVIFFLFYENEKKYVLGLVVLSIATFITEEIFFRIGFFQVLDYSLAQKLRYFVDFAIIIFILILSFFTNYIIEYSEKKIYAEQQKSDNLLLNILPVSIVKRLKLKQEVLPEKFTEGSVLFADIVGFTHLTETKKPEEIIGILNEMFSEFDHLTESLGLEKIKTIGDAYMVAGGIPEYQSDHLECMAKLALAMQEFIKKEFTEQHGISVRIGMDVGMVLAGIIGQKKFHYDLWGDAVNTASRMESHGQPGEIQVTERIYEQLKDKFKFEFQGEISVKNKGEVKAYFLKRIM